MKRKHRLLGWKVALLAATLAFGTAEGLQAQVYQLADLGTLGGTMSLGFGINAGGQVAGYSTLAGDSTGHALLSAANGGSLTDLGTLGGTFSQGNAVNDSGQVTGPAYLAGNSISHAFLSAPNGGALTDLGTLGGNTSVGGGVNASGQVAGTSYPTGNAVNHAFLSAPNGGPLTDLGTLGGTSSAGSGVNRSGQVTGWSYLNGDSTSHAFLSAVNGGALRDLGALGGTGSAGKAVNASGQVTGSYSFPSGLTSNTRAFVSAPNGGALTGLVTLGGTVSVGNGINTSGQVVGWSTTNTGAQHGFIYTLAGGMQDLNSLVPGSSLILQSGEGINDLGQIAGYGINSQGQPHAFLLTPLTPALVSAVSRMTHGNSGTFDLSLSTTGRVVEPRDGNGNFTVVFTFSQAILSGDATVSGGAGSVETVSYSGNSMIVTLTGVSDQQTLTISAVNVTGANYQVLTSTSVQMGFLIGDVNGDGVVNVGDTALVRGNSGVILDSTNFQYDVNADGLVNVGDTSVVRSKSGDFLAEVPLRALKSRR